MRLTANAAWVRGERALPGWLGLEVLAQAAICLLPSLLEGSGGGLLAGIDQAVFHAPLAVGEVMLAEIEVLGRFAQLVKVAGKLRLETGEPRLTAELLLARSNLLVGA